MRLALAGRLARRELRAGLAGFRIFLGCLALGVAVIAGVGSLAAAVDAGLARDARALLGGDVELRLFHRTADAAERAYLAAHGTVSAVAEMRAMARTRDGGATSLIELKAVDRLYPLYGRVTFAGPEAGAPASLAAALALRDGVWGAVAAPALLDRLGLHIGDRIRIGDAVFALRAALGHEPDALGGFALGPRVLIARPALGATGLIAPGTLVSYAYRLRLPPGRSAQAVTAGIRAAFPNAGWRIRQFNDAAPGLQRLLDRLAVFMMLVGLTVLLVGGVGIANAVTSYLAGKSETIATLKCLGATRRTVFATYLAEILILAAGGIGLGLVLGALAPAIAAPLLPAQLPVRVQPGLYAGPLLLAAGFGVLTTLVFALWPLGAAAEINPASLFRARVEPLLARPAPRCIAAVAVAALLEAGLAVASAPDRRIALWAVLAALVALAIFRLAAAALLFVLRRAGRPRHPALRLALANLVRPGARSAGVLASLGLGFAVLAAIVLVAGNLSREIGTRLAGQAPSFFFIDIQPDQVADFDRLLHTMPGVTELARMPSLRGRITALNGVPVARAAIAADARWAVDSDRGLTYAATLPAGSQIVAGHWWPSDYAGPPLVSFDAGLARGMGLKLGDTLTVNVLGRPLTARIASLRDIDWTSLGLNFALVFSPDALAGAPQTHIATARTAGPAEDAALERAVSRRFPNVSAISVRDALATLAHLLDAVAAALTAVSAVALVAGVLVLAGAVAASHRRRVYEAVVLKVLGATRGEVARAYLLEYGLLGLTAGVLAAALGTVAAWLVLTRVMRAGWIFLPGAVLATVAPALLLALLGGFAGTWRALAAKAAPLLRNE